VSNFYIFDLKNFSTASYQRTRRRSACGLHLRRSSESSLNSQVYYTLVDCNPLTPLLRSALDSSYKLFLHCYAAVGKILTDTSRRAVFCGNKPLVFEQLGLKVTQIIFELSVLHFPDEWAVKRFQTVKVTLRSLKAIGIKAIR